MLLSCRQCLLCPVATVVKGAIATSYLDTAEILVVVHGLPPENAESRLSRRISCRTNSITSDAVNGYRLEVALGFLARDLFAVANPMVECAPMYPFDKPRLELNPIELSS